MFVSRLGRKFNIGDWVVHEAVYVDGVVCEANELEGDYHKPYKVLGSYERGIKLANNVIKLDGSHIIYCGHYHKLIHLDDAELLLEIKEVFNAN